MYEYVLALLLPVLGLLPSISAGVVDGADSIFHVHRIHAMRLLWDAGTFFPRWVSYFHLGYGYPIFNFYAPGTYLLGAGLTLFGLDAPAAHNALAALAWTGGALGCFWLARQFLPSYPSLLAALLWAYAPSRLYEVWEQGSLPQSLAAAALPWLFLGMLHCVRQPSARSLLALALPYAFILFCHQPTAVIATLFAAAFGLILIARDIRFGPSRGARTALRLAGAALLGVGLAAIFVVPALTELRYVDAARGTDDMFAVLQRGFLPVSQLFTLQGPFDLTDLRRDLPRTLGLVGGGLALLGAAALVRRRQAALAMLLLAATAAVVFMQLEISLPVWQTVPLLAQLRFPERFLRVGVIPLSLLGGAALLLLPPRWQRVGFALAFALVIITAFPSFVPTERFLSWPELSAADEIRMEMDEYIWGSTSYDEFNPIWGASIAYDPPLDLDRYRTEPLHIDIQRLDCAGGEYQQTGDRAFLVRTRVECPLTFRQYYFPGWQARLDGTPLPLQPEPRLGLIQAIVPPGEHQVTLDYVGTDVQRGATVVTLVSIAVCAGLWALSARRRATSPVGPRQAGLGASVRPREALAIGAVCVCLALLTQFWLLPSTTWFRILSPPDAPAAMETRVDADFGGLFTLLGYSVDVTQAMPGDSVALELFWRPQQPIDARYRPLVQIVDSAVTTAYAVSQPFRPASGHTTGWTPDHFASDPHRLTVFSFALPGPARWSVQMIDATSGLALRLPDGSDRLLLDASITIVERR